MQSDYQSSSKLFLPVHQLSVALLRISKGFNRTIKQSNKGVNRKRGEPPRRDLQLCAREHMLYLLLERHFPLAKPPLVTIRNIGFDRYPTK